MSSRQSTSLYIPPPRRKVVQLETVELASAHSRGKVANSTSLAHSKQPTSTSRMSGVQSCIAPASVEQLSSSVDISEVRKPVLEGHSVESNQQCSMRGEERAVEELLDQFQGLLRHQPNHESKIHAKQKDSIADEQDGQPAQYKKIKYSNFQHVLELYGFPSSIDSTHLQAELCGFENSGFYLKWVDDTHCLAVFSSVSEAEQALTQISGIVFKARRIEDASTASKTKLSKSPGDWAMPFKKRPPTSSVAARRMISWHLGLRTTVDTDPVAAERLRQDRLALQTARAQAQERKRIQKSMWVDD